MPPTKIKNKIYENQKVFKIIPVNKDTKKVWINKIIPIDRGCFICIKSLLNIISIIHINIIKISDQKIVYIKF